MAKNRLEQLRERWASFHRQHPEVWDLFAEFSLERINDGFATYSAAGIFERIRWESARAYGVNEWKLNNNYRPFYARLFMETYPEHAGFFRLRSQSSHAQPESTSPELTPADFDGGRA